MVGCLYAIGKEVVELSFGSRSLGSCGEEDLKLNCEELK